MSVFDHFADFASQLRADWAKHSYNEAVFSELAQEHLMQWSPAGQFDWRDLLTEFETNRRYDTYQNYSGFSDLQLIPYKDSKFYIEVLHWTTGSTTIHEHSFHGAFYLLEGESINAEYDFDEKVKVNSGFIIGDTKLKDVRHLKQGDTRIIKPAKGLIHSVFHLAFPSITIVVRTNDLPWTMPQYEYRTPHIALDTQRVNIDVIKRVQARSLLAETDTDRLKQHWLEIIERASLDELYWTYRSVSRQWMSPEFKSQAEELIAKKPGGAEMLISLAREKEVDQLIRLRASITDYHQRMLIALLSIITQRQYLLSFLNHYYGKQMSSKLTEQLTDFAEKGFVHNKLTDQSLLEHLCNPELSAVEALNKIRTFISTVECEELTLHPITGPFLRE